MDTMMSSKIRDDAEFRIEEAVEHGTGSLAFQRFLCCPEDCHGFVRASESGAINTLSNGFDGCQGFKRIRAHGWCLHCCSC